MVNGVAGRRRIVRTPSRLSRSGTRSSERTAQFDAHDHQPKLVLRRSPTRRDLHLSSLPSSDGSARTDAPTILPHSRLAAARWPSAALLRVRSPPSTSPLSLDVLSSSIQNLLLNLLLQFNCTDLYNQVPKMIESKLLTSAFNKDSEEINKVYILCIARSFIVTGRS